MIELFAEIDAIEDVAVRRNARLDAIRVKPWEREEEIRELSEWSGESDTTPELRLILGDAIQNEYQQMQEGGEG